MDSAALKLSLEKISAQSSDFPARAQATYPNQNPDSALKLLIAEIATEISDLLNDDPEIRGLMIRSGIGAMSFAIAASRHLVDLTINETPEVAIGWLEKVRSLESAESLEILPLWGVRINQAVNLLENVDLLPFESLPPSFQKDILKAPNFGPDARVPSYTWTPPTAALVAKCKTNVFHKADGDPTSILRISDPQLLIKIRLLLTTIAPGTVIPTISWHQFTDPNINLPILGGGYSFSFMEIQPWQLRSLGEFSVSEAATTVARYFAISPANLKLDAALDRFDRAMRRHDAGDALVELAIALESLLGDGNTELGWKVSLRAALLVEASVDERLEIRKIVRSIYDTRSKVVHSGATPSEVSVAGARMPTTEFLSKASVVTSKVIKAAILKGTLPDWFKAELGY